MAKFPKRFSDRVHASLKKYQALARTCKDRDINESDTVTLVIDILCEILGYDKFGEITKEYQVRATYCDLAIKIEDKVSLLIECKAIGIELKDTHTQQALNYGANNGCEWIVLTNGIKWRIYQITFGQPIGQELIYEFDLLQIDARSECDIEMLYSVSREGADKNALHDYREEMQAKDKFCIAAILMTEAVTRIVRREIRSLSDGVIVDLDEIKDVIRDQCLKRELVEGERAIEAQKKLKRFVNRREKSKADETEAESGSQKAEVIPVARAGNPKDIVDGEETAPTQADRPLM